MKVYYMGKLISRDNKGRFSSLKKKLAKIAKRTMLVSASLSALGWAVVAGAQYFPSTVYAEKEVIKEIEMQSPVMARIAKCESSNMQMRNGQVVINVNKNGTYDMGKYQINSIWNKKAAELGYNLSVEKDNEAFAMWLYKNYGTEPWSASRANCWNK
jgi:hypothetical protein